MRVNKDNLSSTISYRVDKVLFKGKYKTLNNDDRMIYAFIIDKARLSLSNNWLNEKDEVFVKTSRKKIMYEMQLSKDTVRRSFNKLVEVSLIDIERQFKCLVDIIFPHLVEIQKAEQTEMNIDQEEKNEIDQEEKKKATKIDSKKSKNEVSEKRQSYLQNLKQQIDYEEMIEWYTNKDINKNDELYIDKQIYNQVTKTLFECCAIDKPYFIKGIRTPAKELREQFINLKAEDVLSVVNGLKNRESSEPIRTMDSYIISCLYTASEQVKLNSVLTEMQAIKDWKKYAN